MSIKIIADSKSELPEHLQSEAVEVDGKFSIDGSGLIKKNKELLGKNATLTAKAEELEADKTAASFERDEWKSKAKIPNGQKLVAADVAELGEAAKAAELSLAELPTLKTAKADLQKQIDDYGNEKVIAEVAQNLGFNNRFVIAARDKNLRFEKTSETVDGKAVDVWNVKGEGDAKTKVDEFLKTDGYFKEFADTFKTTADDKHYFGQESGKDNSQPVGVSAVKAKLNSRYADAPATSAAGK